MLTGIRILLADDAEASRTLHLSCLQRAHAIVQVAKDGAAAVEFFKSGRYDLVLMDIEMPVMDGVEATHEIRRFERAAGLASTPVLALTALSLAEMTARGAGAAFTDVLIKPILKTTLLEALLRHCPTKSGP